MKLKYLILLLFIISSSIAFSQNADYWLCGADQANEDAYFSSKDVQKTRNELDLFIADFIENANKTDEVYVIPIVFHVVHFYGPENISFLQILDAVEILNDDYRLLNADTVDIINEFKAIAADCKIEFKLAKIDPDGNCTNGVTRTISELTYDGSVLGGIHEIAEAWPRDKYLNIWVCSNIPNGIAGYAYYPSSVSAELSAFRDGVVIRDSYLGSIGTSTVQKSRILTHELAHSFDLGHTWSRSSFAFVGQAANCDDDDEIDDTPNTIGSTTCNLAAINCESLDNVQNYMEYTYCSRMFTFGQKDWMRAALNSDVSGRNNLWTEANLLATGTNADYVFQLCLPEPEFYSEMQVACTGASVDYNNLSHGTDTIDYFTWAFEGANPSSSTEENQTVSYSANGLYSTSLIAGNSSGENEMYKESYMHIYEPSDLIALPYIESFETNTYPQIEGDSYNDFHTLDNGIGIWEHVSSEGTEGDYCIRIQNRYNDDGVKNSIMLPNITITDEDTPIEISYNAAYGRTETSSSDKLRFYVSNDCGVSKSLVSVASSTALTSVYVDAASNYFPEIDHWKTHTFTVNANRLNGSNFRLIIETESGGGNTIYIDEVSYSQTNSVSAHYALNSIDLYPNPFADELIISNPNFNTKCEAQIINLNGKIISSFYITQSQQNISSFVSELPAGIYFLKLINPNGVRTIKLVKE